MIVKRTLVMKTLIASLICLATTVAHPQSPPAGTVLGEATTLIVATAFDQTVPPTRKGVINGWQASIGEWTVKDGVLHGDELEMDHHPSSCIYRLEATDMILTAQFRLGSATQVAFGCRDTVAPNHHLGRTFISKDGIWIQSMSGIAKTTRAEKLKEIKTPVDTETWHELTVEIIGDRYRA